MMYAEDYDQSYPLYVHAPKHDQWWYETIQPYAKNKKIFTCPSVKRRKDVAPDDFGWNGYGVNYLHVIMYGPGWAWTKDPQLQGPKRLAGLARPAETIMIADGQAEKGPDAGWGWQTCSDHVAPPSATRACVLSAEGVRADHSDPSFG